MNRSDQRKKTNDNRQLGAGLAIGVGVGLALGSAMGNPGAGLVIGIGLGISLGVARQNKKTPDRDDESPPIGDTSDRDTEEDPHSR